MIHFRRPLAVALLSFVAGLLPALRYDLPPSLLLFAFVAILGLILTSDSRQGEMESRLRDSALYLMLFGLSGGIAGGLARTEARQDCRAAFAHGDSLSVRGSLGAAHRPAARGQPPPLLPLLRVVHRDHRSCSGEIRIRMPPQHPALRTGATIEVTGRWRTFTPPAVPSRFPRNPRFRGFLLVDSILPAQAGDSAGNPLLRIRASADARLTSLFPDHLHLVEALILGRREYISSELRDRFARAGLSHLLAISGMHVGLLAAMILLLGSAARLSRKNSIVITLATTWAYLIVIGAGPSALRAGTMISLALTAFLLQRPTAAVPIVSAAALALLGLRPLSILDPGFQLSFAGVLGILLLRAPLLTLAPDQLQQQSWVRSALDAFVVGIAAFVATAPIVAHHFGIVAPISILAGVPAVPLMSLALIGALAAVVTDPFFPGLAQLLASGATLSLDLLQWLASAAASVPLGNAAVPRPPWWTWSFATAAGVAALYLARGSPKRIRWVLSVGSSLVILVAWPIAARGAGGSLEIHFIDVGQGDAIAIRTPPGRWVLVDAGPASDTYDAGERRVLPFIRDRGGRRVEALVLTHPDLDHIGGAAAVLQALPVRYVFEPGLAVGKNIYLDLLKGIEAGGAEWRAVRSGRTMELDGVRFDFLWPDPETVDVTEDANQISAVLRLSYGEFSMLLTGDVGAEVEDLLAARHGELLEADVLKLGHHGSATSTSQTFLRMVAPELAVVSAGRDNRYGHPAPLVINRVRSYGVEIARTDQEGSVSIEVPRGGIDWVRQGW